MQWRGQSQVIRCDNGPEYINGALQTWAKRQIHIEYIQPGQPQQNACVERYNPNGALRLAGSDTLRIHRSGTGVRKSGTFGQIQGPQGR